jgi:hypothetical protein
MPETIDNRICSTALRQGKEGLMDQHRFGLWTRMLAERTGRRAMLLRSATALIGLGGAAAMFRGAGATQTPEPEIPVSKATADGQCVMPFEVAVRQGPSAGTTVRGLLFLSVDDEGVASGSLAAHGGIDADVSGQVTGDAVSLRFALQNGALLYGTGVVNGDLLSCVVYDMGGPAVGPAEGDLGDWRTGSITIDPDLPTFCLLGDPTCQPEPTPRPERPPTEVPLPEPPSSCQSEPFLGCLYTCGSSLLRRSSAECLDYCIQVFQC